MVSARRLLIGGFVISYMHKMGDSFGHGSTGVFGLRRKTSIYYILISEVIVALCACASEWILTILLVVRQIRR